MARIDELERKFEENPRRYFAPLANEYRKAGDAQRAAELCRAQLPEIPGHISGHIVLGQALYDSGDFAGSRAALETALALDPENIVALRYLGDIARDTGDIEEAERWYARTLQADPYNEAASVALQSLQDSAPTVTHEAGQPPTEIADRSEAVEVALPEETLPEEAGYPLSMAEPDPAPDDAIQPGSAPAEPEAESAPDDAVELASSSAESETEADAFAGDLEISAVSDSTAAVQEPEPSAPELPAPAIEEIATVATEPLEAETPAAPEPAEEPPQTEDGVLEAVAAEPVPVEESPQTEEGVLEAAAPFVTETMADLYLEQGYPHEALELLLQLSEQRPTDELLRVKIEQIESVIVARREAAVAAARAERAELAEALQMTEAEEPPEVADAVEGESSRDEPVSVRDLFARMDKERPRPSMASVAKPLSRLRPDFGPMPQAQDAGADDPDDPFAFPHPESAPESRTPVPRSSGPQPTFNPSTAAIDEFDAWLRGLKGP